jgi:hypothetical protein
MSRFERALRGDRIVAGTSVGGFLGLLSMLGAGAGLAERGLWTVLLPVALIVLVGTVASVRRLWQRDDWFVSSLTADPTLKRLHTVARAASAHGAVHAEAADELMDAAWGLIETRRSLPEDSRARPELDAEVAVVEAALTALAVEQCKEAARSAVDRSSDTERWARAHREAVRLVE